MQVGEHVVCVDDQFPRPLTKYYVNLPMKDITYTVRAIFIGRGVMHPAAETTHGEIGLLLKELVNGIDPRNKHQQELGFNSTRFRPLRAWEGSADEQKEMVRVRTAPKLEPLKTMPLPYSPGHQPNLYECKSGQKSPGDSPQPKCPRQYGLTTRPPVKLRRRRQEQATRGGH